MPFQKIRLAPGVDIQQTPTLNQTRFAASQLIRFYDGCVQKIGGWVQFSATACVGICRALHGWGDLVGNTYLAAGTEQRLAIYTANQTFDITPVNTTTNNSPAFSTISGSSSVTIYDPSYNETPGFWINLITQVSVGGIVLFGKYQVVTANAAANTYTIVAASVASATVSAGGAVPALSLVTSGVMTVTLNNHGYSVGSIFPLLVPTTVGSFSNLSGYFPVASVIDANHFTFTLEPASFGGTASENGGNAQINYLLPNGPAHTAAPPVGPMRVWSLDNFGQDLIASPSGGKIYYWQPNGLPITLNTTAASANSNTIYVPTKYLFVGMVISTSGGGIINGFIVASIVNATSITVNSPATVSAGQALIFSPTPNPAQVVSSAAPIYNATTFTVPEVQMIMALGCESGGVQFPLLARWCDSGDFTDWTTTATNQAGSFQFNSGSSLVAGLANGLNIYVWTDLGIWMGAYQGLPFVWSFTELQRECGAISSRSAVATPGGVVWLSTQGFFSVAGGTVTPMECPVWDFYTTNRDLTQPQAIFASINSQYHEVFWFFPYPNGTSWGYVKWNWLEQAWDYGNLVRTAFIDQSPVAGPLGVDGAGLIQQHEIGNDANGSAITAYAQTGYTDANNGEDFIFADMLLPDFVASPGATINLTILSQEYPGGLVRTDGPHPIQPNPGTATAPSAFVTCNSRGRQLALLIGSSDVGSSWRLGAIRYRFRLDGKM